MSETDGLDENFTPSETQKPQREGSPSERRYRVWKEWIDSEFQRRDEGKISEDELKSILAEKLRLTDDELTKEILISGSRADLLKADELTEIPSAFAFDSDIEDLIANDEKFGLLMLDIDDFRKLNTKYGHVGADRMIRHLARTLEKTLRTKDEDGVGRTHDKVYRLHGDEKAVLVHGINTPEELRKISERLRRSVEENPPTIENGETVRLSVSIGGAVYDGSDVEKFIDMVDKKALYGAKENGKNNSNIIGLNETMEAA
jgi:diguanylate cyclase (GGDEF)-like protein